MLRATIVGTEWTQLLAIHTALVAMANDGATDLKIVNLKNRLYSDDADLAGYRDMNYALCFNGVTCELQIMLQVRGGISTVNGVSSFSCQAAFAS